MPGLQRVCPDEFGAKKKPFGFFSVTYVLLRTFLNILMVPKAGIEPARLAAVDFESTASTDFATSALKGMRKTLGIIPLPTLHATTIRPVVMQVLKKSAVTRKNLTQPPPKLSPTTKASNQRPPFSTP